MPNFDVKKWLKTDLAEDIIYNNRPPIRALVKRYDSETLAIQSVNTGSSINPVEIEVSVDDISEIVTGMVGGDKVTMRDIEGKERVYSVMQIIEFSTLSRSYKLGLV